jgi:hypothetical protein
LKIDLGQDLDHESRKSTQVDPNKKLKQPRFDKKKINKFFTHVYLRLIGSQVDPDF